jgi:hypothetical protein
MALNFINDYITGDKLQRCATIAFGGAVRPESLKTSVRCSKRIWCKTDYVPELFRMLQGRDEPLALLTHNSDIPIDEEIYSRKPACVKTWIAQNVKVSRPDLLPITIGIENLRSPGYSGDPRIIEVLNKSHKKEYLAFLNMNVGTNIKVRRPVWEQFKDKEWVVPRPYGISFKECMTLTRKSKFVFAPPGNGLDTHRVAESVYLGAIPIVIDCHMYRQQTKTAPMLLVDSYEEVTEDLLENYWSEVWENEWTYNEWKIRYWEQFAKGIIRG